jgi:hypothetical protein
MTTCFGQVDHLQVIKSLVMHYTTCFSYVMESHYYMISVH